MIKTCSTHSKTMLTYVFHLYSSQFFMKKLFCYKITEKFTILYFLTCALIKKQTKSGMIIVQIKIISAGKIRTT